MATSRGVRRFAERERLFRRVRKVAVAVSGGADSMAALLVLRELREAFGFELLAVHFDHQLRPGSRDDLARVREICGGLGVEFVSGEGDVARAAREARAGIEETARRMRYQFLAFVAGKEQAGCIATGHTRDDQVETVLMRFLRGTGVRGLQGMLPSAPVPGAPAQRLVRPLLEVAHAQALAICDEAGLAPLDDPSNRDLAIVRNRLRLETLPALRALNPSLDESILGVAASAREAFAAIEHQALGVQPKERSDAGSIFEVAALRDLPGEALILLVEREGSYFQVEAEVNRTRVENLRSALRARSGCVRFGSVEVEVSSGLVRIGPPHQGPVPLEPAVLQVPGTTVYGGYRVEVSTGPLHPGAGWTAYPAPWIGFLDTASTRGVLRIRQLRAGDRLKTPAGLRTVSDLLVNARVPRWQRREILAVTDVEAVVLLINGPPPMGQPPDPDRALYVRATPLPRR